jgi:hypothetical protein
MKLNKSRWILAIIGVFMSFFYSCEKESEIFIDNHQKISNSSFNQLLKQKKFANAISYVNNLKTKNRSKSSRNANDLYDFKIVEQNIRIIKEENKTSYTLLIYRDKTESYFENLVLEINQNNQINAYLLKYTPDINIYLDNKNEHSFKGKIEMAILDPEKIKLNPQSRYHILCYTVTTYYCANASDTHIPGVAPCEAAPVSTTHCMGYWDDSLIGNFYLGETANGSVGGGSDETDLNASPILPDGFGQLESSFVKSFYNSLSEEAKKWVKANPDAFSQIINYQYENQWSSQSWVFTNQLIDYCVDNPNTLNNSSNIINKYLDILVSINSTESFKNNQKLNCIFEKVKNTKGMNYYLKNFDSRFSTTNLIYDASTFISSNTHANTTPPINNNIKITFNTNALNRPILDIARTFIHETIHAEIFRKLLSLAPNNGQIDVQLLNTMLTQHNYPGLYDYYNRFGINGMQHEQMAAHYREIIVNFLKEVEPSLSEEQYKAMAWVGLQDTTTWDTLSDSEKLNIENTYLNWYNNANQNCQ